MLEDYCTEGDGLVVPLDADAVVRRVDHWLDGHRTPVEEARADRRAAAYDAQEAADQAERESYRENPVGHSLQYIAGAVTETRELLLELQKHVGDSRVLEVYVRDMLTTTDLQLARCDKAHASWFASIGARRDPGLMKFVVSSAGGTSSA